MSKIKISQLVRAMYHLVEMPDFDKDCFSGGQIASKEWLVNELVDLDIDLGIVFICAGWYSTLSTMLFESGLKIEKIRSFDIDPRCVDIAERFNKPWVIDGWKFKASTMNIHDMKYPTTYQTNKDRDTILEFTDMPDTIINTSCEHIVDFDKWYKSIPSRTLLVLQTNNYFDVPEHVNCSNNLQEFAKTTPMSELFYEGTLELPKYQRYMRIGIK